jgi:hypothetical protein
MPDQHGRVNASNGMFHGTYDRAARAERNRAVAAEYNRLFKATRDPYLASYYLRIAKDHLARSLDNLRALERENYASAADGPSVQPHSAVAIAPARSAARRRGILGIRTVQTFFVAVFRSCRSCSLHQRSHRRPNFRATAEAHGVHRK